MGFNWNKIKILGDIETICNCPGVKLKFIQELGSPLLILLKIIFIFNFTYQYNFFFVCMREY